MLKVDLNKSAEALKLSLAKSGVPSGLQMELAFDLDVSGSFDDEHRDGITQDLLTRLTPWGMVFDPDQQLDVFTFSNGASYANHVGTVNPATVDGYVARQIIDRVPGYKGGTDYSYVLEENLKHFGWLGERKQQGGFLGFGKKTVESAATGPKRRSLILFVTDGDNSDHTRTEQVLAESERRRDQIYVLFVGISNQGGNFPFLQKMGDRFSNTGLVVIRDLRAFVNKTDDALNAELMQAELIDWLKK